MKTKTPQYSKTSSPSQPVAVAALSINLIVENQKAPNEIQLTPVGFFKAKDGRPVDLTDGWFIDESIAKKLIEYTSYSNDRVIDYEHQTLLKEQNGQPAPAAGWFSKLQWRESGLWATNVTWTPTAERMILDGEYRYISPVMIYDPKTGHVLDIIMAAITNHPAIDGMENLAKLTLENFQQLTNQSNQPEDNPMDLKTLLIALNMPENTTEEEALAALTALQSANTEAQASIVALTAKVEAVSTPDPSEYAPVSMVAELQAQVVALTNKQASSSVTTTVDNALASGHLLPAQQAWATSLGNSDMAALTNFIENATPISALGTQQSSGDDPAPKSHVAALTADQKQIRASFGFSDEDHQVSA
ncbi:MAG: hypothetical protein GXO35_07615 [Gammaproteobacteria bacterium]|nr:hypothetical protein [Gammaproteobacteria bacterium]